jgi:hypothetical protein
MTLVMVTAGMAVAPITARQEVALKDLMPKGMVIGVAIDQRQSDLVDTTAAFAGVSARDDTRYAGNLE